MKATQLLLVLLAITFLYSCDNKSSQETKTSIVKKDSSKKETPKKIEKKEAPFVYGIDISNYQGNEVNFINTHKDSLGFVFCKATQGDYYVDPKFQENWTKIKEDGFIRGTYHFYMSKNEPQAQAEHFAKTIKGIEKTDIAPVIDFEGGGIDSKQSVAEVMNGLLTFISVLEKQLGRKPMIYTDIPTADKYLRDERFSSYALWIANYVKKDHPDLPITWNKIGWTFWQRNADYKIDDFTDDSDVFNGSMTKLQAFIQNY